MKEIVIISGKGGTGKTSITAAFAALAERRVLADCDVDAADLHLVVTPTVRKSEDFSGGKGARIIPELCTGCGTCKEVCRFDAVCDNGDQGPYRIDPIACEGCGVCAWFCPEKAVDFSDVVNGQWFVSDTRFGTMVHARLGIAEENSGKLISLVRKEAKAVAEREDAEYIIVDGSPGIGCPVISSITDADLVVIVTEPTVSGEHDFDRVAELAAFFKIPAMVCVNKADLNPAVADNIVRKAEKAGVRTIGMIPYDKAITRAQMERKAVTEYTDGEVSRAIRNAWQNVRNHVSGMACSTGSG